MTPGTGPRASWPACWPAAPARWPPRPLSEAPVAFSMVLNDEALDRLWQAEDGILAGARPPRVWVDCSTVSPAASERAAAAAAAHGDRASSAPRSAVIRRVVRSGQPDLRRVGAAGRRGRGQAAAVHHRPQASTWWAAGTRPGWSSCAPTGARRADPGALAEALVLGQSHGVRRGALMEFINDSAIGSPFTRYKTGRLRPAGPDAGVHPGGPAQGPPARAPAGRGARGADGRLPPRPRWRSPG